MVRLIATTLLVCLSGLVAIPALSQEELSPGKPGIVIATGTEGGGYWSAGSRLQAVAGEMGLAVENLPSQGSLDNLERLLDGNSPVNLAFAQADALQHYLNEHPDVESAIDILENIGQECVFIITSAAGDIHNDRDLQAAQGQHLAIPSASSGIAVTYEYIVSQVPELADIEVSYGDTLGGMERMNTPQATVDAVMVVHRPRELSAEAEAALSDSDRYRFLELGDERLTVESPSGLTVYRTMNLAMPGAPEPVKTICVRGLLLGNKQKLTGKQRDQLTDLVSYQWMRVYATP